jgi:hypothetical protein
LEQNIDCRTANQKNLAESISTIPEDNLVAANYASMAQNNILTGLGV